MEKLQLIKVELEGGKLLDVVEKSSNAESEFYVTFQNFDKIKKYIEVNRIKKPISNRQFNMFVESGMIKRKAT